MSANARKQDTALSSLQVVALTSSTLEPFWATATLSL